MTTIQIPGHLYSGVNSLRSPAILSYSNDGWVTFVADEPIAEDSIQLRQPIADLSFSSRIGNTPRFVKFDGSCQFECADNEGVDLLLKLARQQGHLKQNFFSDLAHRLESRLRVIIFTLVLVVLASGTFVKYGIPYFGEELAMWLPAEASAKIGEGSMEMLDRSIMQTSELSKQRQDDLSAIFDELKGSFNNTDPSEQVPLSIVFRKSDALGANAFALPSGTIIFTDEMVLLAENNDQLKTIMLHEMGHIIHRHSLRQLIQQSSLALVVVLLTGDISTTSSLVVALPGILLQAGYSQEMELEADDYALAHLSQFNLKASDFADIMSKLDASHQDKEQSASDEKENDGLLDYFSSHPATQTRIERFLNSGL